MNTVSRCPLQRAFASTALTIALLALPLLLPAAMANAQEKPAVTQVTSNVLVFATSSGNVVASVGPDGALLVGTPSADSAASIESALEQRTKSHKRYVVIFPENPTYSQGDAGWGRTGAFVAMQEKALERLGGHKMGAPQPLPTRLAELGVDRPRISFDHVLSFDINGDAMHIVHQEAAGYSNADCVAHFHVAHLVYLGEVFPGDGYPRIDVSQGGTLKGLIDQLGWTDPGIKVVPARGPVTNGSAVKAFADMITTVRDRVQKMIAAGKSEEQIVAAHPTADFDARYGHGRVQPDAFVREIYAALQKH
jgi:cyclase